MNLGYKTVGKFRCWPWSHKWSEWQHSETSEPMLTTNGVKFMLTRVRVCAVCGRKETKTQLA